MAYRTITFAIADGIARLTLNRPDRLNSFNVEMHDEVRAALDAVAAPQSGARVLVLTGADRGFCAGQDLGDRAVAPGGAAVDLGESIEKRYKPLVLALRAPEEGSGDPVLVAEDFRVGDEDLVLRVMDACRPSAFIVGRLVAADGGPSGRPALEGPDDPLTPAARRGGYLRPARSGPAPPSEAPADVASSSPHRG